MSYDVVTNRIPQLKRALTLVDTPAYRANRIRPFAERFGERILTLLKQQAPVGQVEPDYDYYDRRLNAIRIASHGRPSIRQHGMTLASGWSDPQVDGTPEGVTVTINSAAPHMRILLDGSPGHTIPFSGSVSFWWYKMGREWLSSEIHHPGFKALTFVRDTIDKTQDDGRQVVQEGSKMCLTPLRGFFGGP